MSRRRSSTPISLFSFQDIITSVTGIMVLVTLLIALELSQRVMESPRVQTAVVSKQLENAIDEAEEEIRQLQSQLTARDAKLQQAAAHDQRRMAAEADDLKRQVEQLEAETVRLAAQAENSAKKQGEMQSRREEKEQDVELVAQLKQKVTDLAEQIEKLKASNRVIYNPAQGSSKAAWLVELTGQTIRVAAMGRAEKPVEFAGNRRQALSAFRKWVAGRNHRSEYFVLLIKSSGIDLFDQLHDELTQDGFDLGFDVVDDNLDTIDPETGAGI